MSRCLVWLCVLAVVQAQTFDVMDYGAKGDGKHDDTVAIRKAAAALAAHGGGEFKFPGGHTFLTSPFNLTSNTILNIEVGATVLGVTNSDDWPLLVAAVVWPQFGHGSDCTPGDESCRLMRQAFVFSWKASNISLIGGGTLDPNANEDTWWKCAKDLSRAPCNGYGRPHSIMLSSVDSVLIQGITVKNSPDWTIHMSSVNGLHVDNVTVLNPHDAPNSDGIDLDCVANAIIENSYFDVGDDALCVKSGIDYFGRRYAHPSHNILFRNINIAGGHGISIGSESSGGVFNVTFDNITMSGTDRGPRIKSQRGRGGLVDNIVYRNIHGDHLGDVISFSLNYHTDIPKTNATATPRLTNVIVEDCSFSGGGKAEFDGLKESPITNVTLNNVDFGDAEWGKCDYVNHGVCIGHTTKCPPCFSNQATQPQDREWAAIVV